MAKKGEKKPARRIFTIGLVTTNPETHKRYLRVTKKIRETYKVGAVIPEFVVEALEAEEARGFEGLKKYI